jgi:hypothetical protein
MGGLESRSAASCHTFQRSSSLRWRPCPYRLPESGYTMGTGRQSRPRRSWGSRHLVRIRVGRFCGQLHVMFLPWRSCDGLADRVSNVVRGLGRRGPTERTPRRFYPPTVISPSVWAMSSRAAADGPEEGRSLTMAQCSKCSTPA